MHQGSEVKKDLSPTVGHPTVLLIDKVQLEASLHWSPENLDCRNHPPTVEGRAVMERPGTGKCALKIGSGTLTD